MIPGPDSFLHSRFGREARLATKLAHTNIVNAIDAGEAEGHH